VPDLELKVLWETEDVTAAVNAAMAAADSPQRRNALRKETLARLEAERTKRTGLKTETVELYQGGEYWLYSYRTFKDVRLVCAPRSRSHSSVAIRTTSASRATTSTWRSSASTRTASPIARSTSSRGAPRARREDDLVFVAGHPGRTNRRRTVAQYEFERDVDRALRIKLQEERVATLNEYAKRGAEEARQASGPLRGLENNLKRERGFLELLSDPAHLAEKRAAETTLRARIAADTGLARRFGDAWRPYRDGAGAAPSARACASVPRRLAALASTRSGTRHRPHGARAREAQREALPRVSRRESGLAALPDDVPAPIYPALEEAVLKARFESTVNAVGLDDAWVRAAMGDRSPAALAHEIATGSRLADVAERKRLIDGGRAALEASQDPAIQFALRIDKVYREERRWYEDTVESVEAIEGARIARAVFELDGRTRYPDATGTLRLSYGRTAGYEQLGSLVPWQTTFHGLYDRARSFGFKPPFDLPARWMAAERTFPLATPFNFVCTDDIIGGNSGSPVIDRDGRYVGLVFDGNIQSFAWEFGYTDRQARCVSVDSRAIVESLRRVYGMGGLADELTGKR
jgi:hypothetical protein